MMEKPPRQPVRRDSVDSLTHRIWAKLNRPLTSDRFDDTVHFAGTGLLVLAASTLFLILAWKDLNPPGVLMLLGAGIFGGALWIGAGWALWARKPWADAFAATVTGFALVCQIVFIGPWKLWTLVLTLMLWGWIARARR